MTLAAPTLRTRWTVALGAALALIGWLVALPGAVPARAAAGSYLRLAHLSPDTPNVDVYLATYGGRSPLTVLRGVGYSDVSPYQRVEPGLYVISMRPAGAPSTDPAVISTTVRAVEGGARTVAGVGLFSSLGLAILTDDLSLPPANSARMRIIHASAKVPSVEVSVRGGPTVAKAAEFAKATGYTTVTAGDLTLQVGPTGATPTAAPRARMDVGAVYSVIVYDGRNGRLATAVHTDARGAQPVPRAGVDAGLGPVSDPRLRPGTAALFAAVLTVAALGVAILPRLPRARRYPARHARP